MDLTDPIYKSIVGARVQLLIKQPFFGNMAMMMPIVLTSDDKYQWCSTAATDGRSLYFNREFVKSMAPSELQFVLAHEVMHAIWDHIGRRGGRDPDRYNQAADYVINSTLVEGKIGTMPPVGLISSKYTSEWTSEQVYDDLEKNNAKIEMNFDQHVDGQGGASKDRDGKGGAPSSATVSVGGDGDGPPVLSAEELEEIRQQVLSNVIQSMQAADASQTAGFVPAGVRRMVNDLLEPKMDWRTMIDCHVRSQLKNDYTLTRLSRVDVGEFIFPAEDDDLMAEADIWIDTSGSMGADLLREILSEIKGIMQTFGEFKLRVGCFDAKAYEVTEFTERNIDDIDNYQMQGGGGTLFGSFWNAMADEGRVPERMICFTDGYPCDSWGDGFENYCDTLWVVHGGSRTKAPFGLTVFYEDADKA